MRKSKRLATLEKLNVTKKICNHVIGKEHGQHHRVTAGIVLMVFGVFVAQLPVGHLLGHVLFETIGFLFHCVGAIPLVQIAEKIAEKHIETDANDSFAEDIDFEDVTEQEVDEIEEKG